MKALFIALFTIIVASGCASSYTRVIADDGVAALPAKGKVELPAKPNVQCVGEWVWNITRSQWACVTNAPASRAATIHPWYLGLPYARGPGYTSGYISGCTRRGICFGSSWVH